MKKEINKRKGRMADERRLHFVLGFDAEATNNLLDICYSRLVKLPKKPDAFCALRQNCSKEEYCV